MKQLSPREQQLLEICIPQIRKVVAKTARDAEAQLFDREELESILLEYAWKTIAKGNVKWPDQFDENDFSNPAGYVMKCVRMRAVKHKMEYQNEKRRNISGWKQVCSIEGEDHSKGDDFRDPDEKDDDHIDEIYEPWYDPSYEPEEEQDDGAEIPDTEKDACIAIRGMTQKAAVKHLFGLGFRTPAKLMEYFDRCEFPYKEGTVWRWCAELNMKENGGLHQRVIDGWVYWAKKIIEEDPEITIDELEDKLDAMGKTYLAENVYGLLNRMRRERE